MSELGSFLHGWMVVLASYRGELILYINSPDEE